MKIAIVLGTRPEIIKMVSVIDEIISRNHELILIHTGQHYDHEMSDQFFEELELPIPNYNIEVGSGSHGEQTGKMMDRIEKVLVSELPDIVLVQGDTNAVFAGATVASKLHIPVGHVEAGLRSYDITMPEEINRKAADVCSKYYFVPTEQSAINLAIEGFSRKSIFVTGNTVVDACFRNLKIAKKHFEEKNNNKKNSSKDKNIISNKNIKDLLKLDNILTLTMHRAENVDNKERLINIFDALAELQDFNIIFPIHPRTENTIEKFGLHDKLNQLKHIHFIKPLGYLDFLLLISKSLLILTDSGGIQEEAITLNIPALTLRYNTERPETVSAGGNILVGSDKEAIVKMANKILKDNEFHTKMREAPNPYGDGSSGKQIMDIIEDSYNNGHCVMKTPDEIMDVFKTAMATITEDITVKEYEIKNDALIRIVYEDESKSMKFPFDDLNLKGTYILYDEIN